MKQKGFGIIELMVVLGIIGILGAIAVPQYNKYVTKTRITEALHAGQVFARKVESEAAGGGSAGTKPSFEHADIDKSGSGETTRIVITLNASIDSEALIAYGTGESAGGKVLELAPAGSGSAIRWDCKSNLPASKLPKVCTYSADVGGIAEGTAWADVPADQRENYTACWGAIDGTWRTGENSWGAHEQSDIRETATQCLTGAIPACSSISWDPDLACR